MLSPFRKKKQKAWDPRRLPRHIAIIMDGNGRWGSRRALPRTAGHAVGAETFRRIATYCKNIGIEYLTVYAFSSENWKRPIDEINTIMELLEKYLREALETMERERVRMKFFGDLSALSPSLQELIAETEDVSRRYDGVQVNICINYGGRDEIVMAAKSFMRDVEAGEMNADELTAEQFADYLYSSEIPDPDVVIRPGGEMRVSNFLIWQAAYSEWYFTDVLWPDFSEAELDKAIIEYQNRERRYGGVKN